MAGLRVGQAYGGVPPTWVWVVGVSPQTLEHPTSICDTGVKIEYTVHLKALGQGHFICIGKQLLYVSFDFLPQLSHLCQALTVCTCF